MTIFDLHNDYPTQAERSHKACIDGFAAFGAVATAVIWTTEIDAATVKRLTGELKALGAPIAIEDMGFAAGGEYTEIDYANYLYCSLTWNNDNPFAGGALGSGELTELGREAIVRINGAGTALDLSHINKRSFYAALDMAERPICSHTAVSAHPRCLDVEQIKVLSRRRALIGICAVTAFTGAKTVSELARHIADVVSLAGADLVCLGTDFYGSADLPTGFTGYADVPKLKAELYKLGMTEGETDQIFYKNAKRFYEEIYRERHL